MSLHFYSLGMVLQIELVRGDAPEWYADALPFAIVGLEHEENQ